MNIEEVQKGVRQELFELQDLKYRDFHAKLIPTMEKKKLLESEHLRFADLLKNSGRQKSQNYL